MISFAFTADQIRAAPPEVWRWLETEIVRALREAAGARPEPAHANELAACADDEALATFDLLQRDFTTAHVFLEFGRETPLPNSPRPLHAFAIAEFRRKLRLTDDGLAACFAAINQVFMQVRNDPDSVLLGLDRSDHVYVHETTHASLRVLWERLAGIEADAETPSGRASAPFACVPPHIGPSEEIAAHQDTAPA